MEPNNTAATAPDIASDLVTSTQLADMLRIHSYTVPKIFGAAYVGRRKVRFFSDKMYSLTIVAKLISEASGYVIKAKHIPNMINRKEAMKLLNEHCGGRCARSWGYWQAQRIGPRILFVSTRVYYLRDEVVSWAKYLNNLPRGAEHGDWAGARLGFLPRTVPANGANGGDPDNAGDVGVALHLSQTSEGAV